MHVHVPKCAGTAVRVWLYRAFPNGFGSWYPDYVFDEKTLETAGLGDLRLRAVSSHCIQQFPAESCGRTMQYFTLLRKPVDHVISWVRYHYQIYETSPKNRLGGVLPLREFVERLLNRPNNAPFRENMQTNFFALYAWCESQGPSKTFDPTSFNFWAARYRDAYVRERLDVAKDVLRSFLAVGVVDRVIDSLELLRTRCAPLGFELAPSQELTFENVTRVMADDTAWIGDHDPVGRRLLASLDEDEALYAFARRLLDEGRKSQKMSTSSLLPA